MGRLKNISTDTDADYFASYVYDKYGSLDEAKANNNSIITDYDYNNLGQLTLLKNSFSGKYYEEKLFYENNNRGLISSIQHNYSFSTNGAASYSTSYSYDKLGRLTTANNSGGIAGNDLTSATFDDNGNILSYTYNGINKNYQYYANNQVKNTDGSGADYQYDAIGNIVNSPVASSITYHQVINLPLQVNSGGNQLNLQYNGGNQRVLSDDGIQKRMYIHGTNDYPMLEKVKDGQGNEKIIQYVYGAGGMLAMKDGTSDWNFMLKDHLGSNRLVLNSSNVILGRYDFAAYGQLMGNTYESATDDNYRFTGQEYDQATGLYNYRARLYDPDLGRFYAMDPAGQFASPYVGIGNNPVMMTDSNGEFAGFFGSKAFEIVGQILGGAALNAAASAQMAHQNGGDPWEAAKKGFGSGLISGIVGAGINVGLSAAKSGGFFGSPAGNLLLSNAAGVISNPEGAFNGRTFGINLGWSLINYSSSYLDFNNYLIPDGYAGEDYYVYRNFQDAILLPGVIIKARGINAPIPGTGSLVEPYWWGSSSVFDNPVAWDMLIETQTGLIPLLTVTTPLTIIDAIGIGTGLATFSIAGSRAAFKGFVGNVFKISNRQLIRRSAQFANNYVKFTKNAGVTGTLKHTAAKRYLKIYQLRYGDRGLSLGSNYFNGPAGRGFLDVVNHNTKMIYDFKFGKAFMSNAQYLKYSNSFPGYRIQIIRP